MATLTRKEQKEKILKWLKDDMDYTDMRTVRHTMYSMMYEFIMQTRVKGEDDERT